MGGELWASSEELLLGDEVGRPFEAIGVSEGSAVGAGGGRLGLATYARPRAAHSIEFDSPVI